MKWGITILKIGPLKRYTYWLLWNSFNWFTNSNFRQMSKAITILTQLTLNYEAGIGVYSKAFYYLLNHPFVSLFLWVRVTLRVHISKPFFNCLHLSYRKCQHEKYSCSLYQSSYQFLAMEIAETVESQYSEPFKITRLEINGKEFAHSNTRK